jgi:hypothetical protein
MAGYNPFNPLDKRNLAESIVGALEKAPYSKLPPENEFTGAGVYLLYYEGPNPLYKPLVSGNKGLAVPHPIYVGKAAPSGARMGGFGLEDNVGKDILKRLREHAKSIEEVNDLELKHFKCKFLTVDDIWIPLGEQLLIQNHKPIWNSLLTGFGIHVPGKGRDKQARSLWDEVHVGRSIAKNLPANKKTQTELVSKIHDFWKKKD